MKSCAMTVSKQVDPKNVSLPVLHQVMEYARSVRMMLLDEVAHVIGEIERGMGMVMNGIE